MNGLTELIFSGVFDAFTIIDDFIVLTKYVGNVTEDDITAVLNTITIYNQPIPSYLVYKSTSQTVSIG